VTHITQTQGRPAGARFPTQIVSLSLYPYIHMLRSISSPVLEKCAASLRVLAHPVRLRIVESIEARRLTVGELAESLDMPQAVVSQHLARMKAVGLLNVEREGRSAYYRICDPSCTTLLACIRKHHV